MDGSIKVNFPPVSLKAEVVELFLCNMHTCFLAIPSTVCFVSGLVSISLIRCHRSTELLTISQQTNLAVDLYCGSQDAITRRNHSIRVDQSDTVFYSRVEHFNDLFPTVLLSLLCKSILTCKGNKHDFLVSFISIIIFLF